MEMVQIRMRFFFLNMIKYFYKIYYYKQSLLFFFFSQSLVTNSPIGCKSLTVA